MNGVTVGSNFFTAIIKKMKLYLSSVRIPSPDDLAALLGKPLKAASVALIPNSKDCFVERARTCLVDDMVTYMQRFGLNVEIIDLRDYDDTEVLMQKLASHDLIWAMGGNTFSLRYEMKRSGFDRIIRQLVDRGVVYGGDSAGALVAGLSIAGIESADRPEFAEEIIEDGLGLVPFYMLPHVDGPSYANVVPVFRKLHKGGDILELKDSQAAIFNGDSYRIVNA